VIQEQLIKRIHELFEAFSILTPKEKSMVDTPGFFSLFSKSKDVGELALLEKYIAAKDLVDRLDSAMVDDWEIDELNPEALAAYLPQVERDALYLIIGPSWTEQPALAY
jgi:hypothetical protein